MDHEPKPQPHVANPRPPSRTILMKKKGLYSGLDQILLTQLRARLLDDLIIPSHWKWVFDWRIRTLRRHPGDFSAV
jgi:hypothetical protein